MIARFDPQSLRAAWWTLKVLKEVQGDLPVVKLTEITVTPPPRLPPRAILGVKGVLHRRKHTCLMRAIILRAWYAGQGDHRQIVIGVTKPSAGFRAHAWVEGELPCQEEGFEELTRWSSATGSE